MDGAEPSQGVAQRPTFRQRRLQGPHLFDGRLSAGTTFDSRVLIVFGENLVFRIEVGILSFGDI